MIRKFLAALCAFLILAPAPAFAQTLGAPPAPAATHTNASSIPNYGLSLYGDSITNGLGATDNNPLSSACSSWACILYQKYVKSVGAYNNYGIDGITVGDIDALLWLSLNPSATANPIVTEMGGTNDRLSFATPAYALVYDGIQAAAYARAGISPLDTLAGNAAAIAKTGTWTTDITYPNITGAQSAVNGSTACDATFNAPGGALYVYYGLYNGATVNGTFSGYISGTTLTTTTTFGLGTGNIVAGQTVTGAGVTAGTHIVNGSFSAGPAGTGTYTVDTSQTVGSAGSPVAFTFTGTAQSSGGAFKITVDGADATDSITGGVTLLSQPAVTWITAPGTPMFGRTVGLARVLVSPGVHNVCVVVTSATSAANPVNIIGFAAPPVIQRGTASPKVFAGGVIKYLNDTDSVYTAAANAENQKMANLLAADGLNVNFVDVRKYLNTTLDMTGTLTQNCPASTSPGAHPNDCGQVHMANAYSDYINFGYGAPILQPLAVDNVAAPTSLPLGANGSNNTTDPTTTGVFSRGSWMIGNRAGAPYGLTGWYNGSIRYTALISPNSITDAFGLSFVPAGAAPTTTDANNGLAFDLRASGFWKLGGWQADISTQSALQPTAKFQPTSSYGACNFGNGGKIAEISDAASDVPGTPAGSGNSNHVVALCNDQNNVWYVMGGRGLTNSATTGSLGGSALTAGQCSSTSVGITGAVTTNAAVASPQTYPGDGAYWLAYVSSAGNVTVKVCAAVAMTPTASLYNVRLLN